MRHPSRLLAAGVLPVLLLAGCGGSKSSSTSSSSSGSAKPYTVPASQVSPMSAIAVDTKNAKSPKISLSKKPFQVNKTTTDVKKAGTGEAIAKTDIAYVNYVAVDGATGKQLVNTFATKQVGVQLNDPNQFPGLVKALSGAKVGSTMTIAVPPSDGFGTAGSQDFGVAATDTLVFYMQVNSKAAMLKEATGAAVKPPANLPTVTVPKDNAKAATITIPKKNNKVETAPTSLVSQELIKGTGMTVAKDDSVTVAYTGVIWNTGKLFDASANHDGTATFTLTPTSSTNPSGMIPGFVTGLVGKKVGSRVLLVIPPKEGYGTSGNTQAGISGTDTLVFVVDILAIN